MSEDTERNKLLASFQIQRQLDQEKIAFLTKRVDELLKSNNELRASGSRNEKDTHDIVVYFQREMEMKDEIISKLNEELVKRETQLKFDLDTMKKKYENELAVLRIESEATIADLKTRLNDAETEVISVNMFIKDKAAFMAQLQRLEKELKDQRQQMFDALDEQERKFLEEKSQFLKELDEQRALLHETALKEAREAMGAEVKKILQENNRIHEEVKFLLNTSNELHSDKSSLEAHLVTAKREVAILTEKEVEYAKQSYLKTREIKSLRERVEFLEKQAVVNVERFKQRTKELKSVVQKDLEVATLDSAGLRRLLKMKNLELRQMKSLAATILSQRSETEQFFLEALQEVRDVIKNERKKTAMANKITLNKMKGTTNVVGGVTLPKLTGIRAASLHHMEERDPSQLPLQDDMRVEIKDLSWEDKELILRVLFAKMNGQQKAAEKSVANAAHTGGGGKADNVFLSQSAENAEETLRFQSNFEVRLGGTGGSQADDDDESINDSLPADMSDIVHSVTAGERSV